MTRKIRSYEPDSIAVEFDVGRCIHAAECVRGLPSVFDPQKRPWIDPSHTTADEVARVVERCPTGALHYRRLDEGPAEEPPATNTVRVSPDGPLYLSGRLRLELPGGETNRDSRMALCRCGASDNKPYCDGSHTAAGFSDRGVVVDSQLRGGDDGGERGGERGGDGAESDGGGGDGGESDGGGGVLEIAPATNGPILIRGRVELKTADGGTWRGARGALCRCGGSANKPFCDGTHARKGFEAD